MRLNFLGLDGCLALRSGYLVTVNMQHLYECRRVPELRDCIFASRHAHLCVDGHGAHKLLASRAEGPVELVAGNRMLDAWLAAGAGKRLLVIGSDAETMAIIRRKFPALEIVQDDRRIPPLDIAGGAAVAATLVEAHGRQWDGIAIALGVPKQEFLARGLAELISDAPIFCIGGSFEMIADRLPRSPQWLQRLGLEGVWRLALEPNGKRVERLVLSYANFFDLLLRPSRLEALLGTGR
ncbi:MULTISPECIES: WecB/TagA/CpsF family glycosyltransferase [Sphingomonas]|uniref:WecB/TagA/CpsF family glycosyltransferase n=1 Tax=Sphingomonas TaxID=13687 RepID=UPI00083611E1|nr:WecB/TagA/CpsF family glycosyltransferase [Sphingomonas sp. CCH10-B3]